MGRTMTFIVRPFCLTSGSAERVINHGEIDGLLGPLTGAALANYQRGHDLYITSTIDQPTLSSLGMV